MRSILLLILIIICSTEVLAKNYSDRFNEAILSSVVKNAVNEKWDLAYAEAAKYHDNEYSKSLVKAIKIYQYPSFFSGQEMVQFFEKNDWIPVELFANRFEVSLKPDYAVENIIDWFTFRKPQTSLGKFYFLHANIERKTLSISDSKNRDMLRYYWRITEFDLSTEEYFLKKYKNYLTIEDCLAKVEFLTWQNKLAYAEKLLSILPGKYNSMANLRIRVARNPELLFKLISGRTIEERSDEYVQYVYINKLLENDHGDEALRRLKQIKSTEYPEKWWKLRNMVARNEFKEKRYLSAYNIASKHGLKSGSEFAEAEALSGWLSLRFLREYDKALIHFRALFDNTKFASSRSKAAYWVARTYEAMESNSRAREWYSTAAEYGGTFYGHIALGKIHGNKQIDYFSANYKEVDKSDHEKAWRILLFANYLYKNGANKFARQLIEVLPDFDLTPVIVQDMADVFVKNNLHGLAVHLSKNMANKSGILIKAGYPKHIEIVNNKLPKSLYLGMIRQESNFNHKAVSSAGAYGLMQLMPGTAAEVSKDLGLKTGAYISDPYANVLKGVTYVNKLYNQYQNLVLTLAAYNAGPGSVNKWLSRYGDPRDSRSEYQTIDWIESIPFSQTRDYVKKVLENFVIYDSILSKKHAANTLIAYLENQ